MPSEFVPSLKGRGHNGRHGSLLDWMRVILALRVRATYLEICERTREGYSSTHSRVKRLKEWGLVELSGRKKGYSRRDQSEFVLSYAGRRLADAIETLPMMEEYVLPVEVAA